MFPIGLFVQEGFFSFLMKRNVFVFSRRTSHRSLQADKVRAEPHECE